MKTLIWIIAALSLVACLHNPPKPEEKPPPYTYESSFDPAELNSWKLVKVDQTPDPDMVVIYLKNPDQKSAVRAAVALLIAGQIVSYAYIEQNEVCYFVADPETARYRRQPMAPANEEIVRQALTAVIGDKSC